MTDKVQVTSESVWVPDWWSRTWFRLFIFVFVRDKLKRRPSFSRWLHQMTDWTPT